MLSDVNIVMLVKGAERYCFYYQDDQAGEMCKVIVKFAVDKDLSFSWSDAEKLVGEVRENARKAERECNGK